MTTPAPRSPAARDGADTTMTGLHLPAPSDFTDWRQELTGRRLGLASLQAEAVDLGRPQRAEAFRRLGLMTDLWECLAEESPPKAGEISAFCAEAFERLTAEPGSEHDEVPAWLLQESSARWGDYLLLIDQGGDPSAGWPAPGLEPDPYADQVAGPEPDHDDEPSAIDAGALFRMLTGDTPRSAPDGDPAAANPPAPELFSLFGGWSSGSGGPPPADPAEPPPAFQAATFQVPAPPLTLTIDAELREIFLAESGDLFDRVETLVLSLGRGQRQTETLNEVGRCFHTLKGAAGSVGLLQLAALVHAMEEQLELAAGEATDGLTDLLHRLLHYLEGVFIALRRGGQSPSPGDAREPELTPADRLAPAHRAANPPPRTPAPPPPAPCHPTAPAADGAADDGPVRVTAERLDELMDLSSELITRRGLWAAQAQKMKEFAALARASRNRLIGTIDRLTDLHPGRPAAPPASASAPKRGAIDHETDLPELVRRLAEQADDLVVLTESAQAAAKPLADNSDALARLSLQLWESLQAVRIVPVRGLFQRLARVAHDAARVEGRHVDVVMVGETTGVDRAVQDKAFEPLLHVVRNAVCHGIDTPDERSRGGKPATGRVTLEAARSGNTLVLSVRDDGRGLNHEAIAAKGRRLGLIGPDDAPTVERLNALIFHAGFSTREEANAIAGRGVGMDVVSQEVGRLHGSIAIDSRAGEGTRMSISLPSRLALQQAMVIRVDGQAFALPVELIELAQPYDPAEVDADGPHPSARVRGSLVPMISAREALGLPAAGPDSCPKLLLIRSDGGPLAVMVDAIDGTSELVVKPLGPLMAGHPLVSGTSLSVTGEVILALNPAGLARWPRERPARPWLETASALPATPRSALILVVDDSISVRKVVARQLRALGHQVEEVSDGLEALGRIRSQTYALVLSDLEMPRMDGFELLAELSRLEISPAVPVVVASTRSDPETRRRVLSLGAREFIPKPIEPDVLTALVRDLFPGHAVTGPGVS